jgi:hypothetical protein
MSNYLRNVAHRAAGASLLRPRVPSRFEPVAGIGPAMNHFREVVTEREAEAPRASRVKETHLPPPPVLHRTAEPQVRHEEARATTPPATRHTAEERAVNRKTPEIDQPRPVRESRTQTDSVADTATTTRSIRPEITQEPSDTRVLISRDTLAERAQPQQEPIRPTVRIDVPVAVPSAAQLFPAPTPERQPERRAPVMKAETQIRSREFPVTPAPARYAQPAVPQTEIAAPSIHVTIGKVTVQATLPAAPVHVPARTPAHNGPRLTLERYLDRRGGRP